MSVRVNDRHLSDIEYENTYSILNQYISNKIKRLPKRYNHFLGEPFNELLNDIYEDIMKMTHLYLNGKSHSIDRYRLGIKILDNFKMVKLKKLFSDAIGDLYAMSRPIRELSCFEIFNEKDLNEICNLITDSIKIIRTIKSIDDDNYKNK